MPSAGRLQAPRRIGSLRSVGLPSVRTAARDDESARHERLQLFLTACLGGTANGHHSAIHGRKDVRIAAWSRDRAHRATPPEKPAAMDRMESGGLRYAVRAK